MLGVARLYSPSTFAHVLDFAAKAINIHETDQNPHWHFYMKTIFAMLATRVKLDLDWKGDPQALAKSSHSRQHLFTWYNKMAASKAYDGRDWEDLVRIIPKSRRSNAELENAIPGPDEDDDERRVWFEGWETLHVEPVSLIPASQGSSFDEINIRESGITFTKAAIGARNTPLVGENVTRCMEGAMEVPSIHGWRDSTNGMQHLHASIISMRIF